ncbi:MAG: NAD(P)H nitroreductase [Vulcanimicrobiaceae bacterium]
MDAIEAIRTRRSVGKVAGDLTDADVRELVDLALCAPNHKATAPWRFTIVRGDARVRLGRLWADVAATGPLPPGVERPAFLEKEARKATRAPVIVVTSTRTDEDPVVAAEDFAATAAATQNVLLGAHARGFGAVWRTGAMAYHAEVKAFLGLDPRDRIVAFIYIGVPAMGAPATRPPDSDAFVRELR